MKNLTENEKDNQESIHIPCSTYTNFIRCFGLYMEQDEVIHKWMKEHDQAKHLRPGRKTRYAGAIGGAYTYRFTPTSLGTVVKVKCDCGEEIDVTDYDNW